MASGLRIIPETIRSIDSATYTGSYQKLGTPLSYACCLAKFVNNGTTAMTISWNGVDDHDFVPANSFALYDVGSDAGAQRGLYISQGTQFWVKGTAGTGLVYLTAFHTSEL